MGIKDIKKCEKREKDAMEWRDDSNFRGQASRPKTDDESE